MTVSSVVSVGLAGRRRAGAAQAASRGASRLEASWGPDTEQLPHHETEMEAPHMDEHTLENVRVTSLVSEVSRVTQSSANSRRTSR